MKLVFSGTRAGMTVQQHDRLDKWLETYRPELETLRHGACIGADVQFHNLCYELGLITKVYIHPSNIRGTNKLTELMGLNKVAAVMAEDDPLSRDLTMVQLSDILIFAPQSDDEVMRSGTWATYRKARKLRVPAWHIMLDGTMEVL